MAEPAWLVFFRTKFFPNCHIYNNNNSDFKAVIQ